MSCIVTLPMRLYKKVKMVVKARQQLTEPEDNIDDTDKSNGKEHHSNGIATATVLRSRRTHSVGRAQDIQVKEKRERAEQPDHPVHEPKDSLFSSSSGFTNYRGVLNLFIILLVLSNARVALENVIKYGILVDPIEWIRVVGDPTIWPSVQIIFGLSIFILNSLWIEKFLLATDFITENIGLALITINAASVIIIPAYIVYTERVHPVGSSVALGFVAQVFLKLISYHMVNYWCRQDLRKRFQNLRAANPEKQGRRYSRSFSHNSGTGSENDLVNCINAQNEADLSSKQLANLYGDETPKKVYYPQNLNVKDIAYFSCVPTLCYELNFPRSQRIRKRFLIRRGFEMFFLIQLILALVQQWIVPTMQNSTKPLQEMNYVRMVERLLKLAIPNHIIWLIFFYWYFHSCTNFVGEVLKFADREFYRDWWNSNTVPYFWSNWNIPVHKWCLRHLYKPLLAHGWTRFQASVAVFFVSAFFHEYLVSVPLKMFRVWAFNGMMFQIPFAMIVSKMSNYPQWANTAVWLSLIIGQPLCIMMYYHDYYIGSHS